jgi:hypothetical protein
VNGRIEPLRITASACVAGALVAVAGATPLGHWRVGAALALGLLVGATNGFLARRALGIEANFGFTAVGRLALLSAAGLGLGLLLGLQTVPLVLLGIAAAQLVLAVVAGVTAVRTS